MAPRSYKRKRLSYASYQLAKQLDQQKADANLAATLGAVDYGALQQNTVANVAQARAARRMFGRGAYWGRDIGQMAGSAIGGRFGLGNEGGAIGARFGDWASSGIERVIAKRMGRGAYSTNSLIDPSSAHRPVASASDETGDIVITHSEYVQDIVPSASGFQTQKFQVINPGLPGFVPWVSQIAQYFEEYEMLQCAFEFKSMVTEGNSTAAGTVMMATQYNPLNAPFSTKQAMENYEHANSCKMTDSAFHGVECDPSKHGGNACEYIRTGPVPPGQDAKTYDLAVFQLATNGATPGINVGELWVHYSIRFSKAKVLPPGTVVSNVFSLSAQKGNTSTAAVNPLVSGSGQYNFCNILSLPSTDVNINDNVVSLDGYDTTSTCLIRYTPTGVNAGVTTLTLPEFVVNGSYILTIETLAEGTGLGLGFGGGAFSFGITGGTIDAIDTSQRGSLLTSDRESAIVAFTIDSPAGVSSVLTMTGNATFLTGTTVTKLGSSLNLTVIGVPAAITTSIVFP